MSRGCARVARRFARSPHGELEALWPIVAHRAPEMGSVIDEGLRVAQYQLVVASPRADAQLDLVAGQRDQPGRWELAGPGCGGHGGTWPAAAPETARSE